MSEFSEPTHAPAREPLALDVDIGNAGGLALVTVGGDLVDVELVGPRPGEAVGGAFSFGRARGLVEGVLAAQGVPARHLTPATWKRAIGIPAGRDGVKDMARAEACRRWPGHAERFSAKGSDELAEAGLIAVAGMAREAQGR